MITSREFLNTRLSDGTLAAHGVGVLAALTQSSDVWDKVSEILDTKDHESGRWTDNPAWEYFVMGWNAGTEIYKVNENTVH